MYDAVIVRAMLTMLSLFPLGSYLRLSDGRVGRVIRPNVEDYTRPLLEVWQKEDLGAAPNLLDLKGSELTVESPLSGLKAAA